MENGNIIKIVIKRIGGGVLVKYCGCVGEWGVSTLILLMYENSTQM